MSKNFIKHGVKVQKPNYYPNCDLFIQDSYSIIPEGHTKSIRSAVVSSDSSLLVTSGEDMKVLVWSLSTFKIDSVLKAHDHAVEALAISSNNQYVASASEDFLIIIWDLEIKDLYNYITIKHSTVRVLEMSPDNNLVVAGCSDKTIKVWNIHTGQLISTEKAHSKPLKALKIMKSMNVISAGDDYINVWEFPLLKFSYALKGHKSIVTNLALSKDEKYLASGGTNGSVIVWNLEKKMKKVGFSAISSVTCINFSRNSEKLVVSTASFCVMIIEINSMENIQEFKYHKDMICLAILNKEEDSIISVGTDKRIRAFKITNAKESSVKTQEIYEVPQHLDKVTCVIFSSDEKKMITSGKGKDIKIWNTTTKELDNTIIGHLSSVTYLALSTDDNLLLSASQDMKLNLWNLKNYKKIISLKSETDVFLSCCFCNKNKFIIAGGNNCIKIWDIEKEKQVGAIQCTKTRADSLTLDKKQKYLVTASGENTSHHIETEKNSQLSARFKFFIWNFENFLKKIGLINEND